MKSLVAVLCLIIAGFAGAGLSAHSALAASGGNSDAAHQCENGGYVNLIGTNGTTDVTFANTGECVSYAAHGGSLVPSALVSQCLNGGYANLAPADTNQAFSSEAACVAYILGGGTPEPLGPTFVLTSPTTISASANQCWVGATVGVTPVLPALFNTVTYGNPGSTLCFQSDGNLVIYSPTGDMLWSSGTSGHPNAILVLQSDGNLVIYDGATPLWNSMTSGNVGDCAVFQGDGNLVIYASCTT